MSQTENRNGVRWDGTVNWPFLLGAVGIAVSFVWSSANASRDITAATANIGEIRTDVREMRTDIGIIKSQQANVGLLRETVADHESRIRNLEGRGK